MYCLRRKRGGEVAPSKSGCCLAWLLPIVLSAQKVDDLLPVEVPPNSSLSSTHFSAFLISAINVLCISAILMHFVVLNTHYHSPA